MPGKLRVHELAKQLGVTSKELLATLKEKGEFVKTASSTIEPPVVKKMKEHYASLNPAGGDDVSQITPKAQKEAAKPQPTRPVGPKPAAAKPGPTGTKAPVPTPGMVASAMPKPGPAPH